VDCRTQEDKDEDRTAVFFVITIVMLVIAGIACAAVL
jgi:hypothetical protein